MSAALDVLWCSARTQWAEMRSGPFVVLVSVVHPAVLMAVTLGLGAGQGRRASTQLAFGVLLTSFWGSTVWTGAGILRRERFQGTLAKALTGVRDPRLVLVGKASGASIASAGLVLATLSLTFVIRREPITLHHPQWVVVGLATVLASGTALGMVIGGIFVRTRYGPQVSSALTYPVFLLGGMLIPPEVIPGFFRPLTSLISFRWLQEFLTSCAVGSPNMVALSSAAGLTAAYGVGGAIIFRRMVDAARVEGTVDLV